MKSMKSELRRRSTRLFLGCFLSDIYKTKKAFTTISPVSLPILCHRNYARRVGFALVSRCCSHRLSHTRCGRQPGHQHLCIFLLEEQRLLLRCCSRLSFLGRSWYIEFHSVNPEFVEVNFEIDLTALFRYFLIVCLSAIVSRLIPCHSHMNCLVNSL